MNLMGIIFANIYDSSLGELTNKRTMASLPYGGRYRQIDFTLSNMTACGIRHIGIISRYNYQSLMNHVGSGEEWDLEMQEGGLEFLTPYASATTSGYKGKLDALNSAIDFLEFGDEEYVVLADPGMLYNMDLKAVVENHIASGKDITIVMKAGVANGKKRLDMAITLKDDSITDMAVDYEAPEGYLASIGLFVIAKDLLIREVKESVARNLYRFERDFVLRQYQAGNLSVNIYNYDGVVLFTESTEEYYKANLATIDPDIRKALFRGAHPVYTKVRDQVPSYYGEGCNLENCTLADGCMLEGTVRNSVLFRHVNVGAGAVIEDSVIMNDTVVGENCYLKCVILDKDVVVSPGARLVGTPTSPVILKRGETV
jgi:glucose-1-phosphate adenylyltransferase